MRQPVLWVIYTNLANVEVSNYWVSVLYEIYHPNYLLHFHVSLYACVYIYIPHFREGSCGHPISENKLKMAIFMLVHEGNDRIIIQAGDP